MNILDIRDLPHEIISNIWEYLIARNHIGIVLPLWKDMKYKVSRIPQPSFQSVQFNGGNLLLFLIRAGQWYGYLKIERFNESEIRTLLSFNFLIPHLPWSYRLNKPPFSRDYLHGMIDTRIVNKKKRKRKLSMLKKRCNDQ